MKILLFFKSHVWFSWGRWKRCFEEIAPIGVVLFLLMCFFLMYTENEQRGFIALVFFFQLMLVLLYYFMFKPDWYEKIKYDDGKTAYFAVFGTRYLYSGRIWLKGRFVRFSVDEGFEVFTVSQVFKSGKMIFAKTVMGGCVAYYPNECTKKFIGSQFMGCDFLYDDHKSIHVLCEDRLVKLDYARDARVCYWLFSGDDVLYQNVVTNEVYKGDDVWKKQFNFTFFNICLALEQEDGTFRMYILFREYWKIYSLVCQISGAELEDPVLKHIYVPDDKDSSVYHLKK